MNDDLKKRLEEIKKFDIKTYRVMDLTLDVARSNEEVQVQGSYLYALTFDGTDLGIKLNSMMNSDIPMRAHRSISGIFHRIFITHTAQAGKVATLLFGVKSEFSVEDWS